MELLRDADRLGFDIPLDRNDFPGLSERAEWKKIAARIAERETRTPAARVAFTLAERGLVAEGIAADAETGELLASSIRQRKILRVRADGALSDFVDPAGGGLLAPLGMKIDVQRNLLWSSRSTARRESYGARCSRRARTTC